MDYELRIVVEKVAVSSQEVVKRDTLLSFPFFDFREVPHGFLHETP